MTSSNARKNNKDKDSTTHHPSNGVTNRKREESDNTYYTIRLSFKFVCLSLALTFLVAFVSGYAARKVLIQRIVAIQPQQLPELTAVPQQQDAAATVTLPPPKVRDDKEVPSTYYSAKITNTTASASAHTMLLEKKPGTKPTATTPSTWKECVVDENYEAQGQSCQVSKETSAKYDDNHDTDEDDEDDEAPHLPAGQHLLVDIKNVNRDFLNSEQRLAQAMVDVVWESDLTLLSYHCHSLFPIGVSCVGVLLESHISFHTWPENGVITLDLFTCGSGLLLPILPLIERLFAIPEEPTEDQSTEPPIMIWIHKLRGFRPQNDATSRFLGQSDLATDILGVMDLDMKKQIATVKTDFQTVDIWDIIDPKFRDLLSYKKSLSTTDDTYEAQHPDLYAPDRQVFLDGMLQSTRMGNEAYHEALVHPGMFTHLSPKRVAIIGGGEGATLREVLKHKSVQHVKMIEIDCIMVKTSREFLPSWNSCSDISGSTHSCFDDPRADILCEDALSWFIDRFSTDPTSGGNANEDKFDVIIMDALDPQDDIPFAEVLYNNDVFTQALYNALTDDGVIVMQLGVTPDLEDISDQYTKSKNRAKLTNGLSRIGFDSMHAYEESHCGFSDPWSFLVACKKFSCRERWYTNSASLDLDIRRRIIPTVSGLPTLKYFDGSTMSLYRIPSKPCEVNYCRQGSPPNECTTLQGYDPSITNIPESSFEVKLVRRGNSSKVGLFSKVDIDQRSMILQEKSSNSIHFYPTTTSLIYHTADLNPLAKQNLKGMLTVFDRYAFENNLFGNTGYDMHSSILSLVNHGCHGTHNIGADLDDESITEETANAEKMPVGHLAARYSKGRWENIFNPIVERHLPHLIGGYDVALRDIAKGEEILENLLSGVNTQEDWKYWVEHLRKTCGAERTSS